MARTLATTRTKAGTRTVGTRTLRGAIPAPPATAPAISCSPSSGAYGNVQTVATVGTLVFTVSNTGTASLILGTVTLTGTGYTKTVDNVSGATIASGGGSLTITVTFDPAVDGLSSGTLTIPSNVIGSPLLVGLTGTGVTTSATLIAFPGAEGFGAAATGARGSSTIYVVTNTNDSGAGSLRAALEATGPRYVVFKTGGRVTLGSIINIGSGDVTIAGQTAPANSGGFCVSAAPLSFLDGNVICRGMIVRNGTASTNSGIHDTVRILGASAASFIRIYTGNPAKLAAHDDHGMSTGDQVTIHGSTCTPSIDGTWTITVPDPTHGNEFTIPTNVSVGAITAAASTDTNGDGVVDRVQAHDIGYYVEDEAQTAHDLFIFDHCSMSWTRDENFSMAGRSSHVTVQWTILSEGLTGGGLPGAGRGALFGGDRAGLIGMPGLTSATNYASVSDSISFHHNLMVHCEQRSGPRIQGTRPIEVVSNLLYNWGSWGSQADWGNEGVDRDPHVNMMWNWFKPGTNSNTNRHIRITGSFSTTDFYYLFGNITPTRTSQSDAQYLACANVSSDRSFANPGALTPWAVSANPITVMAPSAMISNLLPTIGARYPARDAVDTRIINDVINGTGTVITQPSDVGGFPTYAAGTPWTDSIVTGMDDVWVTAHGVSSATQVMPSGYPAIEEWINSLIPVPGA